VILINNKVEHVEDIMDETPIKNAPGFYRANGIIINKNDSDYQLILERRKHKQEMQAVTNDVDTMKQELEQLKEIIKAMAK
jgi:Ni2+-binding GTPase involved in maturation of urease and hydrogenase